MEAIVNKLGGLDAALRFLSGEVTVHDPKRIFTINERGWVELTVIGDTFLVAEEMRSLRGWNIDGPGGEFARLLFQSAGLDSYEECHRLVSGKEYKVVLVPHAAVVDDKYSFVIPAALSEFAEACGYTRPPAGIMRPLVKTPGLIEHLLSEGITSIHCPHAPITINVQRALSNRDPGGKRPKYLEFDFHQGSRQIQTWGPAEAVPKDCVSAFLVAGKI
ncbi:MAG TPA: hypothetical protein VG984_00685 [Candidatus Paceibacterota bacterium]|nr:hypothetical protein [Candidatus Paceibacterota bacterium]